MKNKPSTMGSRRFPFFFHSSLCPFPPLVTLLFRVSLTHGVGPWGLSLLSNSFMSEKKHFEYTTSSLSVSFVVFLSVGLLSVLLHTREFLLPITPIQFTLPLFLLPTFYSLLLFLFFPCFSKSFFVIVRFHWVRKGRIFCWINSPRI